MDSLTIPHARPTIRAIAAALSGVLVMSLVLVGTIAFGAKSTAVSFVDYAQCADGTADDAATNCPGSWINGILQASNSTYHEDEVTPQRAELLVPTGASLTGHSFTFSYQTRKGSAAVHAYDSLATWDHTQTTADRNQGLNPSDRVAGIASTYPIPNDPQVLAPFTAPATGVTSTHQLTGQVMTMYGGTITGVSVPVHDCVATSSCNDPSVDDYATVNVTFDVAAANQKVQLLFGGHLAAGIGPRGWGAGFGASNISGGPYHIKWTAADGSSIGNRDNQIMGSAILTTPTSIATVPNPSSGTIGLATLQDTATVTPSSATGTVTFNLFRPADSTCSGTPAYTETVSLSSGSASTVTGFLADTVGTWHWTAAYSGDGVNLPSTSACSEEAVTIGKDTPGLTTTASGPVTVGATITDTAHLSGGYGTLTGTITFDVYGPGDTTCSTSLQTINATAAVTGAGDYTSGTFTTTEVGDYLWIAHFTDTDGNNNNVSTACNDANETSTVDAGTPSFTTAMKLLPNDSATISGIVSGGAVDGAKDQSIVFKLFANGDCSGGSPIYTKTVTGVTANGTYSTDNATVFVTADGTYSWLVSYTGDSFNDAYSPICTTEQFAVDFTPLAP